MKTTIEATQSNFDTEVLKSEQPVLVDFWAPWCGPCKMIAPVIEEIAQEKADRFKVVKVNVDENPEVAQRFEIQAIPTLLYFANGEVRERSMGVSGKKSILDKMESFLSLTAK